MDRNYISAIEGGKISITLVILEKLAKAFNVSIDKLLQEWDKIIWRLHRSFENDEAN